jgi:carboxypeptidase C (cathepsin A)
LKKRQFALVFEVHSAYPMGSGQLAPRKGKVEMYKPIEIPTTLAGKWYSKFHWSSALQHIWSPEDIAWAKEYTDPRVAWEKCQRGVMLSALVSDGGCDEDSEMWARYEAYDKEEQQHWREVLAKFPNLPVVVGDPADDQYTAYWQAVEDHEKWGAARFKELFTFEEVAASYLFAMAVSAVDEGLIDD